MENRTLASIVRQNAAIRPGDDALRFDTCAMTWFELDGRSNCVANGLLDGGVSEGARIGYLGKSSPHFFEVLYGSSKAGNVLVAINWRLAKREWGLILKDAELKLLFVDAEFYDVAISLLNDVGMKCLCISVDSLDAHRSRENNENFTDKNEHQDVSQLDVWRAKYPDTDPMLDGCETATVVQLYTSGTTGTPKGAELSNRYFFEAMKMAREVEETAYDWQPGEVVLVSMPLFHIAGIIWCITAAFLGSVAQLLRDFQPSEVLQLVNNEPVCALSGVPAMVQMLLDDPLAETVDFTSLRHFLYGASPMPPALLQKAMTAMDCKFAQMYGMTESTMVTFLPPSAHSAEGNERMSSVGKPLPGVSLYIVNEQGVEVAQGEIGEVVIDSPALLSAYWKNATATEEAKHPLGFRTGDAGYIDSDGYLYLKDRVKDMIISGGENIYPAEVENALYEHSAIHEIAVVGVPDPNWGEVPKAFIVLNQSAKLELEELKLFAADRIAKYKIPKAMQVVSELPRTASGKVVRSKLRELTVVI